MCSRRNEYQIDALGKACSMEEEILAVLMKKG